MRKKVLILMCTAAMAFMSACGVKGAATKTAATKTAATVEIAEQTTAAMVGMPNPWTECKDLSEAEENTGISIAVPETIPGYTQTTIQTLDKEIIQVFYEKDGKTDQKILIRKGIGTEDISGDYNTYKEEKQADIGEYQVREQGNEGKIMLATWTKEGYTYSVSTPGISDGELENIIQQIK